MRVHVRGSGCVTLTKADFKASGGEGSVYVKNGTAYKVYHDPSRMIPREKIDELAALTLPNIIRPREVLLDDAGMPIGYSMRSVEDAAPLCGIFPPAFRNRAGLTPERVYELVRRLQTGVAHINARGILVVDLNEMNLLVGSSFDEIFFLDVDSYETASFPATAIMDSIRDRHAASFDEGTDWFAFAVVSFQMFVGIHPYKGTYPPFVGRIDTDKRLDARMLGNISVLHPEVTVPASTLPFDVIPPAYLDWYRAVLDRGARTPPPHASRFVAPRANLAARRVSGTGVFEIFEIFEYPAPVIAVSGDVVQTTEGVYAGRRRLGAAVPGTSVGRLPRSGRVVAGRCVAGRLRFVDVTEGREIPCDTSAEILTTVDGRFYAKNGSTLLEISFVETASTTLATARVACGILEHATRVFDGVAMESLLGAWYAILFPAAGTCHQVRLRELDGYTPVAARSDRTVLAVLAARNGRCETFLYRFDRELRDYDVRTVSSSGYGALELTVLESGVCLFVTDADELEVFSARPGDTASRVVADSGIGGDVRLFRRGSQALFARGGSLYGFRMRR